MVLLPGTPVIKDVYLITSAGLFCDLQNERHHADYNPHASMMSAQTALNLINQAEPVIKDFLNASPGERALVATLITVPGSR